MPNLTNAKKALRQSDARARRNQLIKAEVHSMRRAFRKLVEAKNASDAQSMLPKLQKALDKMVTKNIIKKNTAARTMSRLHSSLNKVSK
jgi:small subunit ribosomal protein S20